MGPFKDIDYHVDKAAWIYLILRPTAKTAYCFLFSGTNAIFDIVINSSRACLGQHGRIFDNPRERADLLEETHWSECSVCSGG